MASSSAFEGWRPFTTTNGDHAGIALVVTILLATWMVFCLLVRLYMRFTASGPFGKDDGVCVVATVRKTPRDR